MIVSLRADRETAARITEEIGNLMKEIETLVEEKKKDSSDMNKLIVPQESKCAAQMDLFHSNKSSFFTPLGPTTYSPTGVPVLHDDIKVSMTAKQLNGSERVLLDGVVTDGECRDLQRLSNVSYFNH